MNTTTKASLGFTVILLVVALVIAVQNMTELKSVRADVEDRDMRIAELDQQLAHEREVYKTLVARTQAAPAPVVVNTSPALEQRLTALELELQNKAIELAAQEEEKQMLVERVQEKEMVREQELTDVQRKIRDAASIGEISHVQGDLGFAVINAGKSSGIEPQMQFAVRRDVFIVGKVLVDSVEDANSSIVNIVQGSVQPGLKIERGDTVIAFPIY
ncbi:MAG: hypothetical protein ACR2RV_05760 [Verrucomicrobiales bacterium]